MSAPTPGRVLCRLDEVPDPGSRGFRVTRADGSHLCLFVVRRGDSVVGYRNRCPHTGVSLDWMPDRFLDRHGARIVCATHGARFRIDDGLCVDGPCVGERLAAVAVAVAGGRIVLRATDA